MEMHKDWWNRAREIHAEVKLDFIRGKYLSSSTDLMIECTDRLQLELKEAKIFETEHLSSARIDMARQLIDCIKEIDNE